MHRGDDDSISGRVTLGDAKLAPAGNVQGVISGSLVTGSISDHGGREIATFTGTVSDSGIRGTYRDRTGEVGEWSWDGRID